MMGHISAAFAASFELRYSLETDPDTGKRSIATVIDIRSPTPLRCFSSALTRC